MIVKQTEISTAIVVFQCESSGASRVKDSGDPTPPFSDQSEDRNTLSPKMFRAKVSKAEHLSDDTEKRTKWNYHQSQTLLI